MVLRPKRLILALITIAIITTSFWLGSRYPALNEKAMMANSASVADTIAAFPILEVKDEFPMWKKIAYTSINWANDNKKGMTFGVLIGGLFLTLFSYLQFKQGGHKLLKTFYGFLLGSPLGVCVNCAAPVFKGVLQSKQAELAFAMMLSSPTMNMVVLTMVFTLFPLYMAVTKTLFVLAVIFIGVPAISTILGKEHQLKDLLKLENEDVNLGQNCEIKVNEGFGASLIGFAKDAVKNIWYIFSRTVPLMALAGVLGAIVSHAVPLDALMNYGGIGILLIVTLVGLFLPVPVAFDVILVNALFSAGMSPGLTLALLCTLGIFSAYSFMITWQSASKHWALGLSFVIYLLAVGIGANGTALHNYFYIQPNIEAYKVLRGPQEAVSVDSEEGFHDLSSVEAIPYSFWHKEKGLSIKRSEFKLKPNQEGRFFKYEGSQIGITQGFSYGIRDYPDPFWIGRGTGSGDFNNDGWVDLVLGSDQGLKIYQNIGGHFAPYPLGSLTKNFRAYSTAFVDWNNDGWLDVFFTTFNQGNYVLYNKEGKFTSSLHKVPNDNGILTVSPSFGDLDRNGYPDVFNGNMALGIVTGFFHYGEGRRNSITYNLGGRYRVQAMEVMDGETMASLVSDLNQDGWLDIYVNNDFTVPDFLFWGGKGGVVKKADSNTRSKLWSPFFSMSIDSGDLNNDGFQDYVASGTLEPARELRTRPIIDGKTFDEYAMIKTGVQWCKKIKQESYRKRCEDDRGLNKIINLRQRPKLSVKDCTKLSDPIKRDDCLLAIMWMIVTSNVAPKDCEEEFGFDPTIAEVCKLHQRRKNRIDKKETTGQIKQADFAFLHLGSKEGLKESKLNHPGGWTWSMKIADLDNDGWLDIFNAEGAVREGQYGFNVLLRNLSGQGFEQKQFSWALVDDFGMFSFTYIDFDHDGDLDIIANSAVGPVRVFENRLNGNQRIAFSLEDKNGNFFGLHGKLTIVRGDGSELSREIKAGGGFQSFDAPIAYFGLGKASKIKKLLIKIPGRETYEISKKFQAGFHYKITLQ